jgi:predicted aminopeptidase
MRASLLGLTALSCSGCFTASYLAQAAGGQLSLIAHARPLSTVIADPRTEPRVQKLLAQVPEEKAYGEAHGLKATENYNRYTDLHRAAAVWVVQACAPLKFESKRWSFPIAGTVPYLGFFDERRAHAYADALAQEAPLDVDVRGASAYSTLGWFKDPVLSTMLSDGPEALGYLANTVLHESVHATLYIPGQSSFNESLASFVADALTLEWMSQRLGSDAREVTAYQQSEALSTKRIARLHEAYEALDAVYRSDASDDDKHARKAELISALKADLQTKRVLNNASLAGFRTYDSSGPAFKRLLARCGGDMQKLLQTVAKLSSDSFPEPQMEDFTAVIDALQP